MTKLTVLLAVALLPGCATILHGSNQTVAIDTVPTGASCAVVRDGANVGTIAPTPGILPIDKSRKNLVITCTKPGYQTATVQSDSTFNALTFINFAIGGGIGFIVDAASGANFDYKPSVVIALTPVAPPALPAAPATGFVPYAPAS